MLIFEIWGQKSNRIYISYLPKGPPDVETHGIQPEESSQKEEMHANSCNKKKIV